MDSIRICSLQRVKNLTRFPEFRYGCILGFPEENGNADVVLLYNAWRDVSIGEIGILVISASLRIIFLHLLSISLLDLYFLLLELESELVHVKFEFFLFSLSQCASG